MTVGQRPRSAEDVARTASAAKVTIDMAAAELASRHAGIVLLGGRAKGGLLLAEFAAGCQSPPFELPIRLPSQTPGSGALEPQTSTWLHELSKAESTTTWWSDGSRALLLADLGSVV